MNRRHGSLMDVDDFLVGERWGGFDCEAIEGNDKPRKDNQVS